MTTTTKRTQARPRPAVTPGHVPLTFAQVRARIQRPRRITELVLDAEAAAEIAALEELLERAQRHDEHSGGNPTAPDVAKRLQEVESQADASRVRFVLEAISHKAYQALRKEHPPTKEQIAEASALGGEGEPAFDPDTFAPALVQAQLVEPAPDPEEFAAFWDELSDGQLTQLWTTAIKTQMQVTELGAPSQTAADVLRSFGLSTD